MKAKFSSWLYQIALNLCKDYLKAKSRHAKSMQEDVLDSFDGRPSLEGPRRVMSDEMSEKLKEAINKLPYFYREAFVLKYIQDLDYEEISRITGVPADGVRVRAYRAREMLKQSVDKVVDTFWREKAKKESARKE